MGPRHGGLDVPSDVRGEPGRIGPELDMQLRASRPGERLQVVLLLAAPWQVASVGPPVRGRHVRRETAARFRAAAADLLPKVDGVLATHGGERLGASPTALGTLAVETTPAGVRALAELPAVQAVLANQELNALAR